MGWPSLFAAVVILGGMQLMATSVIGEYIARIYVQAQARPLYNVAERLNFDVVQAQDELQRASLGTRRRRRRRRPRRRRSRSGPRPRRRPSRRPARAGARGREGHRVVTRIVIVGCGFPQLSLVRAAQAPRLLRHRRRHQSRAPSAVAHCDEFVEVSTSDVDGLCDARRGARTPTAVTTTGSEVALKATARGRGPPRPAVLRRPGDGAPLPGEGRDARGVRRRAASPYRSSRAASGSTRRSRSRARAGSRSSSSRRAGGASAASRA